MAQEADSSYELPAQPNNTIALQEQAAIKNNYDHIPLTFGRYNGMTPNEVAEQDPAWLVWAYNNVKNRVTCSALLVNECEKDVLQRKARK